MEIPAFLISWPLGAVLAIVTGIVVLLLPKFLNYAVAIYLLAIGLLGLLYAFHGQEIRTQAVIALVAGVLIFIKPTVLNYVVGIYLILVGLLEAGIIRL